MRSALKTFAATPGASLSSGSLARERGNFGEIAVVGGLKGNADAAQHVEACLKEIAIGYAFLLRELGIVS